MSSLALMRWLESAPYRYDAGMRLLTLGRLERLHATLANAALGAAGSDVLEIGCGTGALTSRLVRAGARVVALDQNPEMLEQARARLRDPAVTWLERTAAEIDALPAASFDAVVASLCLSEMSRSERAFVLRAAAERLRPGGVLAVADEVRPRHPGARALLGLLRVPQVALAWLIVGGSSRPIPDLPEEIRAAGFRVRHEESWLLGSLLAVVAERV